MSAKNLIGLNKPGILKGLTLNSMAISKDVITLHCNEGVFLLEAYGDCCSDSWFEHAETNIFEGHKIINVETNRGEDSTPDEDTLIQTYRYTIITEKETIDIEMRNESNGYYSGEIYVYQLVEGPESE